MKNRKFMTAVISSSLVLAFIAGVIPSAKKFFSETGLIAEAYERMKPEYDISDTSTVSAGSVPGDVNGDGAVNASDVEIIQDYLVKKAELTVPDAADCNKDGKTDVFDAIAIRRKALDKKPAQTAPAVTTAVSTTAAPSVTMTTTAATVTTTAATVTTTAETVTTTAVTITTTAVPSVTATTTAVTVTTTATTVSTTTAAPATTTAAVTTLSEEEKINAYVNRVAELVNEERAKKGIAPVTVDPVMVDAAMLRAKEIATLFSHDRPDGTSCFTVFDDFNIKCTYCSENIAAGSSSPEDVMIQWINSAGHYNNLMSPKVTEIGVGYCYVPNDRYKYYWVQLFRHP